VPGTIIVKTSDRRLVYVLPDDLAISYGVGVGRTGFTWHGIAKVGRKAKWPPWQPPSEMIERDPLAAKYAGGMPGGPDNPLGARAIYLFEGAKDTLYRIHRTREPWSIGLAVSSGCIRMLNEEVIDLYDRVKIGAKVIVT
jgi:lipoprotein-anchoring transpeptidase ErfK/SrfK